MKTGISIFLALMAFLLQATHLQGQTSELDLTYKLAVDPNVKIGRLDNGLVYYIRKNNKPEKRIEMRLVVNAGSILENDDQQGLAHFMEHMNFNGTRNFPKNELIDFLQKTGVKFGADINAYTSFDETVYMLQLPTDDPKLVETGYKVLEDWAQYALLDGKEIDKERGIIVEEWRLGLGANDRMRKKYFPILFTNSKYADRLPIGKIEVIENFKHETLRDFYRDWYRPDLQAIIVVGDLDPAQAEETIKSHFGNLKSPENVMPRVNFDIPDNLDPLIAIATDKEATSQNVTIFYKHPKSKTETMADFREMIMAELYTQMLNNRLGEIAEKPESPFIYGYGGYGSFLSRNKEAFMLGAMSKENQIGKSIETLLIENERVKRFGFTVTEFERQKSDIVTQYEKEAKEWEKTESSSFCGQYVDHFLSGDPIPGAQKEFKYLKAVLPSISLEEINALATRWVTDNNIGVIVTAPEKEGVVVPAESDIKAIIAQSKTADISAYVDNYREEPLIRETITSGAVSKRKEDKTLEYTEVTLSNGAVVVLKPTEFKNDEILFSAYSLGGNSLISDDYFAKVRFATQVIDMSGIGNFDNVELTKKLAGKTVRLTPYVYPTREGFFGSASPKDIGTLMELVWSYFEQPRKDTSASKAFLSKLDNQMKFMKNNPFMAFLDTAYKLQYPESKRTAVFPTEAQIAQFNLDTSYAFFRDRFSDASDFKFFLVGNFSVDTILPMLEKYIGSLPSTWRKENWKDISPEFAKGKTDVTIYKGTDPQGMLSVTMSEPIEWSEDLQLKFSLLKEILSIKLIEVIREKLSGTYSPQATISVDQFPSPKYILTIRFGCSPESAESLTKAVFKEIKSLKKRGPSGTDLQKAQEAALRKFETDREKNDFWLGKLESVYYNHENPENMIKFVSRVNEITTTDLKNVASKYFNTDHYVRVVLMPEKR